MTVAHDLSTTDLGHLERALLRVQTLQRRPRGHVLFHAGDAAEAVYVIHSGAIDLVFADRKGSAKPLQTVAAGQILGLSAVLFSHGHDTTAIVRTPAEFGYIAARDLRRVLDTDANAWLAVLPYLSHDVSSCWDSMRRLDAAR
jgi:CRP-like cAMP-binding protein